MESLEILGFAKVSDGDITLSQLGQTFSDADLQERKRLFASSLIEKVPLVRMIRSVLDDQKGNRAQQDIFLTELENHLSEKESERVLRTVIDWGRYAEVFAYDFNTGTLSLENPD